MRLYPESEPKPVIQVAEQLGVHHEALRNWSRVVERGSHAELTAACGGGAQPCRGAGAGLLLVLPQVDGQV